MACGIGAYYDCVVRARAGDYVRACKEGPMFDLSTFQLWHEKCP
ncbi:MAG: hypothetical protein HQ561_13460 [Desulfobacteraceae bacterium]|nr:hypothetical protein [Desulfobacteraceae bacterium]